MPISAFVSYSHVDEKRLDRLHKHLAMLHRDGQLQAWTDHDIVAGDTLDDEVRRNLEDSTLFIALVSPDYLASNYCYEKEFRHALSLQERGRMRIVAVIVEPCDWQHSPFSRFLVLPKDGKAVADWTNENTAYLNVVTEIRRVIDGGGAPPVPVVAAATAGTAPARRVKVKRHFDSIERTDFADQAFAAMRTYFEESCRELGEASDQVRARFEPVDSTAFSCTVVNRARMQGGEAFITVRQAKGGRPSFGDISYTNQRHAPAGSANGFFSIDADDYEMFLTSGMDVSGRKAARLTAGEAAARLWDDLVRQAGIEYD